MMDISRLAKLAAVVIPLCLLIGIINIFYMASVDIPHRTIEHRRYEPKSPKISTYADGSENISILQNDQTVSDLNRTEDFISTFFPWSNATKMLPNFFIAHDGGAKTRALYRENTAIVFVHIPKSAGTTTNRCLENVTAKKRLKRPQYIWLSNYVQVFNDFKSGKHTRQRAYFGLFSLGVCNFIQSPCSYFTILRDPIERTISSYTYCKREAKDKVCQAGDATKMTIKEWALQQGSVVFYQFLHNPDLCTALYDAEAKELREKKWLGRNTNFDIPCWYKQILLLEQRIGKDERRQLLDFMLTNMKNIFTVVGLTSKYDETLQLLEHVYDLPFHSVCAGDVKNEAVYRAEGNSSASSKDVIVEKLKTELMSDTEVREALHEDLEIYSEGVRIFEEQMNRFGKMRGGG